MIGTPELQQRVDDLLDAVEDRRVEEVVRLFERSGRLELPNRSGNYPKVLEGRESIRDFLHLFVRSFTSIRLIDRRYYRIDLADMLVAEYRSEGQSYRGRPYRNRYVAFFEVGDEGIAVWREYFAPTAISEALRSEVSER
ncbi:MAG TPA: nuclear transport factor 2 family protein [Acidimicrobiales bacterium]